MKALRWSGSAARSLRMAWGSGPDSPFCSASLRSSGEEESPRAKTASPMPVTGTARSRAVWTVQVPVPFMPAWSVTISMKGLPVAASVWWSTSAVICTR